MTDGTGRGCTDGKPRIRDADGRIRHVRVPARTAAKARHVLKERLLDRPTFASTRVLTPQSTFAPEFAASVLRRRSVGVNEARTIFANRRGGPLSPYNVRRTFRDFLVEAGLGDSGISLRWYRRTGAVVIARGMGSDAAAAFLGHSSTAITEGHYIEPDPTVGRTPAAYLERTLRPVGPDDALLVQAAAAVEEALLAAVDHERDDDAVA